MKNAVDGHLWPRIAIFLEEESAQTVIDRLSTEIFREGNTRLEFYKIAIKPFTRKMTQTLKARLRAFQGMIEDGHRVGIIILIDQDEENCEKLKKKLETIVQDSGLKTKSNARGQRFNVVNRIAVKELESWYFGDWQALMEAYPRLKCNTLQRISRAPEMVLGGTKERLYKLLEKAGYSKENTMQVEIAEKVSDCMYPDRNTSRSFNAFVGGMRALEEQLLT